MRTGFAASALAHAALIAFGLLSLGAAEPLIPEMVDSISVDLVPVSAFSNIRVGSLQSDVVETETPSAVKDDTPAELAQPTGNTEQDQIKPTEAPDPSPAPTINTAPKPEASEPAPEPAVKPEPTPEPAPPQTEPAPVPEPDPVAPAPELAVAPAPEAPKEVVPQPATHTASLEQKRAEFKQQQLEDAKKKKAAEEAKKKEEEKKKRDAAVEAALAQDADQVASIINNEDSRGATTGEGGDPTLGKPTGQAATLSQNELDALTAQIKGCLSVPPGAAEAGVTTTLVFSIDATGNVVGQPAEKTAAQTQLEDAYMRAAKRAVMRCGPYTVAKGQDVSALFNANEF